MCAKFLKSEKDRKHNWFARASERGFQLALRRLCEQPSLGLAASAAGARHHPGHGLPGGLSLYRRSPKASSRSRTPGRINANARASEDTSFQTMRKKLLDYLIIKSRSCRSKSSPATINRAQYRRIQHLAEAAIRAQGKRVRRDQPAAAQAGPSSRSDASSCSRSRTSRSAGAPATRNFNTHCKATICRTCWPFRPVVEEKLRTVPEVQDVNSDLQNRALQAGLVIDRDTASRLGLTPQSSTTRCTTPLASGKSPRCTRDSTSTTW